MGGMLQLSDQKGQYNTACVTDQWRSAVEYTVHHLHIYTLMKGATLNNMLYTAKQSVSNKQC